MTSEGPQSPEAARQSAVLHQLRARLALVRTLLDELERHLERDRGLDVDWLCPVAAQLADEAAGLSNLVQSLPDGQRATVVQ